MARHGVMGRPTAYPDSGVVPVGIGLRPDQAERLKEYATERRQSISIVVRRILDDWMREAGLMETGT
jgi:hypothetical protein